MSQKQRYCLVSDNDGHEYVIKIEDEGLFYQWVESCEEYENVGYEGPDFEDARIDGGTLTFLNPQIDGEQVGNY